MSGLGTWISLRALRETMIYMTQLLDYMPLKIQLSLLSSWSSPIKCWEHTSVDFKLYSTESCLMLLTAVDEEEAQRLSTITTTST